MAAATAVRTCSAGKTRSARREATNNTRTRPAGITWLVSASSRKRRPGGWLTRNASSSGGENGGIGALQTIIGQRKADVYLIAPHGTVDIGDAGVRSTGDLNVAALRVLNADNVVVGGRVTGLPAPPAANPGGLTEASNVAGAAAKEVVAPNQNNASASPSIIIVEVLGYGGGDGEEKPQNDAPNNEERRPSSQQQSYDPNSAFQLIGNGGLSPEQQKSLTDDEKKKFRQLTTQGSRSGAL